MLFSRLGAPLALQAHRSMASAAASATPYLDFASKGPLWSSLRPGDLPSEEEIAAHGAAVCRRLGASSPEAPPEALDRATATRCYELYLPVFYWCRGQLREKRKRLGASTALTVFMSAPQGCGKTTLCDEVAALFGEAEGATCAALSYDDVYLTYDDQEALAAKTGNDLLRFRGSAGTHDLDLGADTLEALLRGEAGVRLPRYDKTLRGGRGDRAPASAWPTLPEPADVVLFEGWMNGFRAADDGAPLAAIHPGLPEVNANLAAYRRWDALADAWLVVAIDDPRATVFNWRLEAERRANGGLDDAQVRDFVDRFLPSYDAYCPALYAAADAAGVDGRPTLKVHVDAGRNPVPPPM